MPHKKYMIIAIVVAGILLLILAGAWITRESTTGTASPQDDSSGLQKKDVVDDAVDSKEFRGRYFTFTYPSDWEIWDDEKDTGSVIVIGHKDGLEILEFVMTLVNYETNIKEKPEEYFVFELGAFDNKIISQRQITINGKLKGSGAEIEGGESGKRTIKLRVVHYKLDKPMMEETRDGITLAGYYAGLENGVDTLTDREKIQIEQLFNSIDIVK